MSRGEDAARELRIAGGGAVDSRRPRSTRPEKRGLDDLAIFGGPPLSEEPLHVGRPNIGDRARLGQIIGEILDRKWLTNHGPVVEALERRIAAQVGVGHCVATCNATVALEIAIRAAGLSGEVIVPSFTFIATAHALRRQGITPVFCDVEPHSHNIDVRQAERLVSPRTTGILGVHVWGRPCAVRALTRLARRRHLRLLFDAAHAFGCSRGGTMIGGFGDAEVFSFHATKVVTAGEGGAIVTNDAGIAARARMMRNFGFDTADRVACVGTNGKMSELAAAMALTSLESMEEFVAANRRNYLRYRDELDGVDGIRFHQQGLAGNRSNYHYVVLEIDEAGIGRDPLLAVLRAENVLARRYFHPGCHRTGPYRSARARTAPSLPHTEALAKRVLCLPTGMDVGAEEIGAIGRVIRLVAGRGAEVRRRLERLRWRDFLGRVA